MHLFCYLNVIKTSVRILCTNQAKPIMKYLNVAEKNDAAKNIAALLSRGASTRREGLSNYNKIYEFDTTIFGQPARMVMTSVSGHLLNYEFVTTYRAWQSCHPVALFDAPVVKQCPANYDNIKRTLEREIRQCQGLIIWTDCDREGENIGFEVIKVCTDIKPNIPVYRAKFSEITAASVFRALNTLGQPNKNISDAVDVRQELDLRTGAAFTRLQTLRFQKVFPDKLSDKLISYGSCQFPTLGFVVERYNAIEEFVPEDFWRIKMNHTMKDLTVDFNWKRDRLFDKNACEAILDICQENPQATVEEVESKSKSKWRPLPLDTVELEKTASRKLRINAKDTMKIAEKLYTQGLISYPRTETNIFPRELNLVPLVEQQTVDNRWGPFAQRVLNEGGPNPRQGRKSDQAHPPIHPTKYANNLNGNEQRIYEYIVRHFLACVSKDAMGHETVVHVDIADEKFLAKGLFILERNYLDVYTYDRWNAKEIHEYRVGETFMPSNLSLAESTTSPPKLLTEADLIALMEKYGIGTDATHAEHIETIKTREYVGLHENIYFVPGTLGMGLVEGYNRIGLEVSLAKPNLRADFEKDLKLICDGHKNPETVRREQIEKYRAVFGIVTERILEIDDSLGNRLEDRPRPLENEAIPQDDFRPVMKCPKCNGDLVIRNRKTGTGKYLSCTSYPQCKNAIWLPVSIDTIGVLEESCNICGPTVKKLRVKFKHNPFLGEPNPNTICIGGCDNIVLDTLNISASSVRGANRTNAPSTNRAPTNNRNVAPNQSTLNNWVTGSNRTNSSSQPSTSTRQATSNDTRDDANASLSYSNAPTFPMPAQTARPTQTVRPSNPGTSNSRPRSFLDAPTPRGQQGDVANGPNANVCSCNQEATLLTVRKEGPNKGRQFYACPNRSCNYFAWASESEPNAMRQNAAPHANAVRQNGAPTIGGLKCDCNLDAAERIVSKDGPNKGRRFFCCPKPMGEGCRFFKWADDVNGTNGNDNGHDPYNGPGGAPNTSWNSGGGGGGGGNWRKKNTNWKSKKKTKSTGTLKPYNKNATQRKPKTCGICRQEGHIRTNCPNQRN